MRNGTSLTDVLVGDLDSQPLKGYNNKILFQGSIHLCNIYGLMDFCNYCMSNLTLIPFVVILWHFLFMRYGTLAGEPNLVSSALWEVILRVDTQ